MIEAKGTREEWKNYFRESKNDFIDCKRYSLEESLLVVAESRGWITKPEWEQAYDSCVACYNINGEMVDRESLKAMHLMHARIVELEKKLKEK